MSELVPEWQSGKVTWGSCGEVVQEGSTGWNCLSVVRMICFFWDGMA